MNLWILPSGIELSIVVYGCEEAKEWVNLTSGTIIKARAFDWDTLMPIPLGMERSYNNKEFVYTYGSEIFLHFLYRKTSWERIALFIEHKTGIPLSTEELEKKIQELVESGAKKIVIITKAQSLGRLGCADNKIIFRLKTHGETDYQEGWNTRITAKGGNWIMKTKGVYITKVVNQ